MENNTQPQTITRVDQGLRQHMLKVYNYLTIGLIVTAIAAYATLSTPLGQIFFKPNGGLGVIGIVILFAPLAMAFAFNSVLNKASLKTLNIFFWSFAAIMGISLAPILAAYTGTSVVRVFLITAATFGAMSIYGYTTQRNLTGIGSYLFMGLIGIIIASIINLFLKSSGMSYIISYIAVAIFVGLTAYDTQKIKEAYNANDTTDLATRKVVAGALSIYLDFVNLFIYLLRIFGDRR